MEVGNLRIKESRRRRHVPIGRGGVVADYVPFYIAPRSPMMCAIAKGNVPTASDRCGSLVYLVTPLRGHHRFICEDSHQRIYGEKVVLSRLGIAGRGRSRRLTLNYRTTAQNLDFAIGLLEAVDVTDLEGESETTSGYRSAMSGPRPRLKPCPTISAELDVVASTLARWRADSDVEPHSIGILTRSARTRDLVQRRLADRSVHVHVVSGNESWEGPAPTLLTMHRAKGLEFRKVILLGIDDDQLPSQRALRDLPADERADVTDRERFLLYVAATRARDELVVTWHGRPSGLLAPIPGQG